MARYFLKTFGCKVNQVESDELFEALEHIGAQRVANLMEADFAIVNTCTVTGEADRKVRKELRKAARFPNVVSVIVTGCSAALLKDELEALDEKIQVAPDKKDIVTALSKHSDSVPVLTDLNDSNTQKSATAQKRIRIPIKVQDGCEDFCSYCIVPFARGKCSSVSADEIISRIKSLADTGTKEVILTGINLGNYSDVDTNTTSFTALLKRIQAETDIYRVRLSSIEPRHLTGDLLDFFAESELLCEHFHIPLQSGSDYVLGDMNRSYSANEYRQVVESIRKIKPHTAITTDIIVGYPSESDDDFQQTLELAKELQFSKTHIFRYSPRTGTAAERLKPLHPRTMWQRVDTLQRQAVADEVRYYDSRLASEVELIIEEFTEYDDVPHVKGTTREYLRLDLPVESLSADAQDVQPGDILQLEVSLEDHL